jgi:hypothetical protein
MQVRSYGCSRPADRHHVVRRPHLESLRSDLVDARGRGPERGINNTTVNTGNRPRGGGTGSERGGKEGRIDTEGNSRIKNLEARAFWHHCAYLELSHPPLRHHRPT